MSYVFIKDIFENIKSFFGVNKDTKRASIMLRIILIHFDISFLNDGQKRSNQNEKLNTSFTQNLLKIHYKIQVFSPVLFMNFSKYTLPFKRLESVADFFKLKANYAFS